ncbi:hypothetical protein BGX38DRAFT_1245904, partial [Terfezia claveryi]
MYKMQAIALLYATHLILSSYPRGLNEWLSSFSVKIRHRMRITRADFRRQMGRPELYSIFTSMEPCMENQHWDEALPHIL